jgi:Tfp pilus assembly protein FimV
VVGFASVVLATVALTIGSMSLSGAQAANHGRPAAGYQGMRQIVVQPGQTLWSIAAQAEPSADPRQVIAEIMTANSLAGSNLEAGQLLWVPR